MIRGAIILEDDAIVQQRLEHRVSVQQIVGRFPFVLQKLALRALYMRNGLWLQDFHSYGSGRSFAFKVKGKYLPSETLNWYSTPDLYAQMATSLACWGYRPQQGDTVIDIGAGLGEEAIVLADMVGPNGRVICVEANPEAFAVLKSVVSLNGLESVVSAFNVAISSDNRPVEIELGAGYESSSIGAVGSGRKYTVPGTRLDALLEEIGVHRAALLKSNIEGGERFVVETIGDYCGRIDHFAIACHDFRFHREGNSFFQTKALVRAALSSFGFTTFTQEKPTQPWTDDWVYTHRGSTDK